MKKRRDHETRCILGIESSWVVEDDGSRVAGGAHEESVALNQQFVRVKVLKQESKVGVVLFLYL